MDPRPGLRIVAPSASPEEAAAIVAAIERFVRDAAAPAGQPPQPQSAWARAALVEGTRGSLDDDAPAWGVPPAR